MTSRNTLKTVVLLAALTALLLFVGRLVGGPGGMTVALGLSLVMNLGAYWFSDRIALSMAGARDVSYEQAPELHRVVERLAAAARLPKPRVYVVDSPSPNAFATGRSPSHAAVAVTTGILRVLSYEELLGVLAHELAHIRSRDTLTATIAAALAGAITWIAHMAQWTLMFGGLGGARDDDDGHGIGSLLGALLTILLAPIAAVIIQLAISRSREYAADAAGARMVGNPLALASALRKLEAVSHARPMDVAPAVSPLFIVNPFGGGGWVSLFSTHPPTAERVARLEAMAFGGSFHR